MARPLGGSSLWDRLRGLKAPPEVGRSATRAERCAAIARARIGPYEHAAANPGASVERLREDAERRLRAWRYHIPGPPEPWRPWRRVADDDYWPRDWCFVGGEALLLVVAGAMVFFAAEVVALAVGGVMFLWWRVRVRDRLIRALRRRHCPDCRYDLRGLEAGLDPKRLGVDVGPRGCPECGAPWPLLPPGKR